MTHRDSSVSSTPGPPLGDEILPAKKDLRQVPTLSQAQSKLYEGIGRSSAFLLESLAKKYDTRKLKVAEP